jgi:hypothetical protein
MHTHYIICTKDDTISVKKLKIEFKKMIRMELVDFPQYMDIENAYSQHRIFML